MDTPEIRIGDRARLAAQDRLRDAYAQGALTGDEFEERTDLALRARTRGDIDVLLRDLPPRADDGQGLDLPTSDARADAATPAGTIARRAVILAIAAVLVLGVATADAVAVFSSSVRTAGPGDDVRVVSLFGSVKVEVPDDAAVDSDVIALFGSAKCPACDVGDTGDLIRVSGWSVFGSVEITE